MKSVYLILFILLALSVDTMGQGCSTCTATAANLDANSAKGLNNGILYLASAPVLLIGFLSYKWYRHNRDIGN